MALHIVAPQMAARQANFLPNSYLSPATGQVQFTNADGTTAMLPVRLAETNSQRSAGFKGVGEDAIDNQFLMYVGATRL